MDERVRVAIVGCGIGKNHAEAYKHLPDRFELAAICDIDEAKAQAFAETFDIPRVVTDLDTLCKMDDIEVIDICTPPHLHFPQIQQTLAAGKHTVCEKPLVSSLQEADALIEVEAQSGRLLMPIFQYRFGHGLQKLKFLKDQGLAGTAYLSTVEVAWRRRAAYYDVPWRGKWRTERGGALLGHSIHAVDILCYIAGPVKSIFARTSTRVNAIEVEDCAGIVFEMADGSPATIAVTLGSPVEITRHRFCFSGFVAESNTRPYTNSGEPWTFTGDTPERAAEIDAALTRFEPLPEGFEGQFYRFYDSIRHGAELPVKLADARVALELITAMYASGRSGQAVELPIGREHPNYGGWLPEGEV